MTISKLSKDNPRNALSFFRKATPAEIRSGTLGFGAVIGKFALIGGTVAGPDAIRRDDGNQRRELKERVS